MAVINRTTLVQDLVFYLGGSNVLPEDRLLQLAESTISIVGDDDTNYSEVLCKVLEKSAIQNKALASTSGGNIKREKSRNREVEYFDSTSSSDFWQDYLNGLPALCTTLGYCTMTSSFSNRFKVKVATPVRVPNGSPQVGVREAKSYPSGRPIVEELPNNGY